jgi:hypothetical protein
MHVPTASRYQDGLRRKDMRVRFELLGDSRSWMCRTNSDSGSGQWVRVKQTYVSLRGLGWNTKSEVKTATTARLRESVIHHVMSALIEIRVHRSEPGRMWWWRDDGQSLMGGDGVLGSVSARMPTIAVSCPAGGTPLPIQKHHRSIRCRHDGRVAAGFCCHCGAVQQCQQWHGRRHEGRRCETHGGARACCSNQRAR